MLAGRYTGAGEGDVVLEGMLNGEAKKLVQRVKFPEQSWGNEFIPQLWAMRRVGWLLDEIRLRGESAELREEELNAAFRAAWKEMPTLEETRVPRADADREWWRALRRQRGRLR